MLEELETFIYVVEYKNFTKAGKMMNLTQPAVSAQVKMLEQYFGTELIMRSNRNMTITESGLVLYNRAQELLELLNKTRKDIQNESDKVTGHLKIGATYTVGECLLPDLLSSFTHRYPEVQVEVTIGDTDEISSKIHDFTLHIGLVEGSIHYSELEQVYFKEDEMVLLVAEDHPFAEKQIPREELDGINWISREKGSGTREYQDLFITKYHIRPKSFMSFGSNLSLLKGVQKKIGITLASKELLKEGVVGITYALPPERVVRPLSYIFSKNIKLTTASQLFIEELARSYTKG